MLQTDTYTSVVVVQIIFRDRFACVSAAAEVNKHGTQGRLSNVILAVNRTLRAGVIAYEWERTVI